MSNAKITVPHQRKMWCYPVQFHSKNCCNLVDQFRSYICLAEVPWAFFISPIFNISEHNSKTTVPNQRKVWCNPVQFALSQKTAVI